VMDGVTGYFAEPKDAPSLAAAIAKVLHDPDKAKSMGASALSRVKRHFAMPQFIEKTLDVYKSALQEL
jgi:glycosyltransferase involved in cell wall biosynthesis